MPLGIQPEQTLLTPRASLLQATAPRDPKPLAELSPVEGQHPCALLQQRRVSLRPLSGCKPLMVPCKAPTCTPAPVSQMLGVLAHVSGEKG